MLLPATCGKNGIRATSIVLFFDNRLDIDAAQIMVETMQQMR
jgi:hypothetical protein